MDLIPPFTHGERGGGAGRSTSSSTTSSAEEDHLHLFPNQSHSPAPCRCPHTHTLSSSCNSLISRLDLVVPFCTIATIIQTRSINPTPTSHLMCLVSLLLLIWIEFPEVVACVAFYALSCFKTFFLLYHCDTVLLRFCSCSLDFFYKSKRNHQLASRAPAPAPQLFTTITDLSIK